MIYVATKHSGSTFWVLGFYFTAQEAIGCAVENMYPLDEHERGYVFMVHAWPQGHQPSSGRCLPCDDCYMREREGDQNYPFDFPTPEDAACGLIWRETDNVP